ncbi:MAG: CoA-binding protein, partial [Actinobacteria bacterium]
MRSIEASKAMEPDDTMRPDAPSDFRHDPGGSVKTDVTGRPVALRDIDLERLLRPKVIAVVGASDSPTSQSALNWRMVKGWSDQLGRRVIPVNPNRETVDGEKCYPSLADIPDDVDVAVVITANAADALRDAIKTGI